MKKEITHGSVFLHFIDRCAEYNVFNDSLFFHSFSYLILRFFKAHGMLLVAIFFGVLSGSVLYHVGLTVSRTIYLLIILTLFLISLRSPKIALFLFFLTIQIHYIAGIDIGKSTIRLSHIFGVALILSILYYVFMHEKKEAIMKRMATPIDISLFLLFTIMTISILQTIYVPNNPPINLNRIYNYPWIKSIVKLLLLAVSIGVFYAIQAMLKTKEDVKKWITRYITIGSIIALYGIIAFVIYVATREYVSIDGYNAVVDIANDLPRIKATELEPSFFGFYLMTIIPVLLALAIRQIRKKIEFYKKNVFLCFLGITVLALFLSGSRGAILAFIFSLLTLFFLNKENQSFFQYYNAIVDYCKPYCKYIFYSLTRIIKKIVASRCMITLSIFCFILSGFFVVLHWEKIETNGSLIIERALLAPIIGTFSDHYGKFWSTRTRLITYGYALDAFQQHPWLGIGYENYNFYTGTKRYLGLLDINITWPEVNNYPLKILAEQGSIGFLAFLLFVSILFYHMIHARNKTQDPFLKALLEGYIATFVGIAVILLFISNITKPYIWVGMAFAIAAVKISYKEERTGIQ